MARFRCTANAWCTERWCRLKAAETCPKRRSFLPLAAMDTLSEMLRELRLVSGFFLQAEFFKPWCINSAPGKEDIHHILPGAEHVTIFHLLTEGTCSIKLPGDAEAWQLQVGDVLILPRGEAHLMGSDLQLAPVHAANLVEPVGADGLMRI